MSKEKKKEDLKEEVVQEETPKEEKIEARTDTDPKDKKIEELEKELQTVKDSSLRLRADFENYKRRNVLSVSSAYSDGCFDTVKALLPVIDSFALAAAVENPDEGVLQIKKQFDNLLSNLGVKEIEAIGKEFDPKLHNAVMQIEDEANSGKIVEVFQKGYIYKDKILRYTMCKVAK